MQARVELAALNAVMVVFDARIDRAINQAVHALRKHIIQQAPSWLQEAVAGYHTLMITYNLQLTSFSAVEAWLMRELEQVAQQPSTLSEPKTHSFQVCYDHAFGLDNQRVMELTGLSHQALIKAHSDITYHVYTVGFAPGFAYLGDVAQPLHVPRQPTPRAKVPAGSVAIANQQTAIYPTQSPGGWNIIGRVVAWQRESGLRIQAGDQVKFEPISCEEFARIEGRANELHHG